MNYYHDSLIARGVQPFKVSGGYLASPQNFGIAIKTEEGFTVAVSCDLRFAQHACSSKEQASFELLRSLVTNANSESLKDFLYIECGFSEEEIDSWLNDVNQVLGSNGETYGSRQEGSVE